ncbi:MAG: hypothetical protein OSJ45_15360 [Lachnospiraceae bacterium]|nr:hypothetical protein [Lachnospiraceae bacterium]
MNNYERVLFTGFEKKLLKQRFFGRSFCSDMDFSVSSIPCTIK